MNYNVEEGVNVNCMGNEELVGKLVRLGIQVEKMKKYQENQQHEERTEGKS